MTEPLLPIDTRRVTQIPLPVASGAYRVASLQDLEYIAEERHNGKYSDTPTLTITSPVDFWRNSKFLIIIREGSSNTVADRQSQVSESQVTSH
jgi:hypothetical protein